MSLSAAIRLFGEYLPLLCCPRCGSNFSLRGGSLICESGHCFDLSAKGCATLLPGRGDQRYDNALFLSRRAVFDGGFYESALGLLQGRVPEGPVLDAGCGEGYYARALSQKNHPVIGVDNVKAAILKAIQSDRRSLYLIADLSRLPARDHCLSSVVNILAPANYAEFARVLRPGGRLIKIAPGEEYLSQIRARLQDDLREKSRDESAVPDYFKAHVGDFRMTRLRDTFPVTQEQLSAFVAMTPLCASVPNAAAKCEGIREITVDLIVMEGTPGA